MTPFPGGIESLANGTLILSAAAALLYLPLQGREPSLRRTLVKTGSTALLALLAWMEGGPALLVAALALSAAGDAFLAHPEHAELYRRNAQRVALTALHAGSREAVYQLYLANLPHMGSPLAQISEPVAADALAYGLLARLVGLPVTDQDLAWLIEDNDLGPGEIAAATSRAEDLFDRYFQSVDRSPSDPDRDRPASRFWGDRGGAEC